MDIFYQKLFTQTVEAGSRRYHFDIRKDTNEQSYMTITEENFALNTRTRLFIFPDDFDKFGKAFDNLVNLQRSLSYKSKKQIRREQKKKKKMADVQPVKKNYDNCSKELRRPKNLWKHFTNSLKMNNFK